MNRYLAMLLLVGFLFPFALAEQNTIELSTYMYDSLSDTAAIVGDMQFDGDWYYANDIERAFLRDDVILAGNCNDEIKLIALNEACDYSLFGLQVGMDVKKLRPIIYQYDYKTFKQDGTHFIFTISERDDGFVETLWVIVKENKISNVVFEAGFGHGMLGY